MADDGKDKECGACNGPCGQVGAVPAALCQPFDAEAVPTQHLSFLSYVPVDGVVAQTWANDGKPFRTHPPKATVGGRGLEFDMSGCLLLEHAQLWQLTGLALGDLVAEVSVAPGEELEIESYRMERTLIEQSREDATQFEAARELAVTDRESASVAVVAAKVEGWTATDSMDYGVHQSATVEFPFKELAGKGSSDFKLDATKQKQAHEETTSSTTKQTEHVHEAIVKSSEKLTTQSKVVVKTSRETVASVRRRRVVRNSSDTAALHLYAYEVVKRYTIVTWPRACKPALHLRVRPMAFDAAFVAQNPGFLDAALVDAVVKAKLSDAVEAAAQVVMRGDENAGLDVLEMLLFYDPSTSIQASETAILDLSWPRRQSFDVLNLPLSNLLYAGKGEATFMAGKAGTTGWKAVPVPNASSTPTGIWPVDKVYELYKWITGKPSTPAPTMFVETAITADTAPPPAPGAVGAPRPTSDEASGMWEWAQTAASGIFLQWRYLYWMYYVAAWGMDKGDHAGAAALWRSSRKELLQRFAAEVARSFTGQARAILSDYGETTALARRLDAFLLVADTVFGSVGAGGASRKAESALSIVLAHLNGTREVYTERFLAWIEQFGGRNGVRSLFDKAVSIPYCNYTYPGTTVEFPNDVQGYYDLRDIRRSGLSYFVPLRPPKPANSAFAVEKITLALTALSVGQSVRESKLKSALADALGDGKKTPAPVFTIRDTGTSKKKPGSRFDPKSAGEGAEEYDEQADDAKGAGVEVFVSTDVRVLADGVHLVAARAQC
jgi:hypothetical protein